MPSGNVKIVRSGILMVREVGELQIQKWLALMVLVLKRVPSNTRLPEATFWLSALRVRQTIPMAPWFQFKLESSELLIDSREEIEMDSSSSRDKSEGLEKPDELSMLVSFFLLLMTESKIGLRSVGVN